MTAMTSPHQKHPPQTTARIHRVEIGSRPGQDDPTGHATLRRAQGTLDHVASVRTARIYLIQAPLEPDELKRVAAELLTDPVTQRSQIGATPTADNAATAEVHHLPGVMDPVAQSATDAIAEMLPHLDPDSISVRTAQRYDFIPQPGKTITPTAAGQFANGPGALANTVIHQVHTTPYHPDEFPHTSPYTFQPTHVPIRELDDQALTKLSRDAHLFLSLDEMRAVRDHYRAADREPTDIELESLAQTWSEHCVHKTLKATIRYEQPTGATQSPTAADWTERPGHQLNPDGSLTIKNLLKSTIAAATHALMKQEPHNEFCISVFEDNAGIVRFDDEHGVCIKVETHNHPSALEPYGGAATGIGGCIRDIMGTGQAAQPIASTDVFCVAPPDTAPDTTPKGVIPPRRILERVVAGVRDYGNRMGIPTVNGAVAFHPDYVANPLVFCGCIGLIPLDRCFGKPQPGDRIIALGGRTGRDGIHGATFSSAELTDTHADEFAHAVQIGNPITQKKTLDVLLQARDFTTPNADTPPRCLFTAITDCGAGGFSSAVGEMAQEIGATVTLETAPLKYQGLTYTEIWISEAQERMVLSVPPDNIQALRDLCAAEDVEMCDLGTFGLDIDDQPQLQLTYKGHDVGRLSMPFLHDGIPTPTRQAHWAPDTDTTPQTTSSTDAPNLTDTLLALLAHPDIASKHWIIRQYDHEVQGGSVIKPLVGPAQDGPSDAAVIRPKLYSDRAIAISCGLQPNLSEKAPGGRGDSYWMTLAAIDEAIRNCVCVGADPHRVAILDNFCWPGCDDPAQLGSLVRAAEACYDGALAYRTPFVSGKDSLSNQFTADDGRLITVPPTLLITALAIVNNANHCVTMDAKQPGSALIIVGQTTPNLGGAHLLDVHPAPTTNTDIPHVDLDLGPRTATAVANIIQQGLALSAHDCSDGGLLVAAAEIAFAGRVGLDLQLANLPTTANTKVDPLTACFAESPSRYLLEVPNDQRNTVLAKLHDADIPCANIGTFTDHQKLTVRAQNDSPAEIDVALDTLREVWLKPLDW